MEMVSPGGLVEIMAAILGLPVATVAQFDRQLAENGLRTKTGRGSSAAQVTSNDAANLLIAILGAPPAAPAIRQAVKTWQTYAKLPALNSRGQPTTFPGESVFLHSMAALPPGHSFRNALAALIDSIRAGEWKLVRQRQAFWVTIDYKFRPTAQISVSRPDVGFEHANYGRDISSKEKKRAVKKGLVNYFDMTQSRSVSKRTIITLAEILGPLEKQGGHK